MKQPKPSRKLTLSKETIRELTIAELDHVAGAGTLKRRCADQSLFPACELTQANTCACPPPDTNGVCV